ncbi:MAG TPA: TolC family protein [Burkholderiaceae bacterium]|nr:TolC family protein [Burkholderiaceae bacterium]
MQRFIQSARPDEPTQSTTQWDLDRLTLAALYFHPELSIARSELGLAQAQAATSRARPNPGLIATVGRGAAGEVFSSPWIVGAAVDLLLESGERRDLRIAEADFSVQAARAALRQASWQVRTRVASALLDVWSAQVRIGPLREQLGLQSQRAQLYERRVDNGENPRDDLRRELTQRDQLAAALAQAEADLARARVDLAGAIGVPAHALDRVALALEPLDRAPRVPDSALGDAARTRALTERADVVDALARVDAAQADLQLQISRRWPDVRLGPGYLFEQGNNRYETTVSLEWPASIGGPIGEARARRDLAANRLLALQARVIGQIDRATAAWATSAQQATSAEALLARAQQRESAAQAQFDAGSADRPALLAASIDRINAQLWLHAVRERQRRAAAELEDALELVLVPGQAAPFPPENGPAASAAATP